VVRQRKKDRMNIIGVKLMSVLFRTELTRFEYAATGTSYGGVVDFLIVKGPPASYQ